MSSRPITVVKAAPNKRKEDKPKPRFDTHNPFAALADLDDDEAFPPLAGKTPPSRTRRTSAEPGENGVDTDLQGLVSNAYMRGSSLPPSSRPSGVKSGLGPQNGRSVSVPLISRGSQLASGTEADDGGEVEDDEVHTSLAELAHSFPTTNSVMSIFVAGLPSIRLSTLAEQDHVRQALTRHLSSFAPPLRVKLVTDLGMRKTLNYAFVDFNNEEDCIKVIQQGHGTLFRGLPLRLEFARGDRTIVLASPGNVDLELLKEADQTDTYRQEFKSESVRWKTLDKELAGRLCNPFGSVELIQPGTAAVGESVMHITFEYREEARVAFVAFSSLPLKAHISVHWLNSPNITAASHQQRRPLHPFGPYGPVTGLSRGPRRPSNTTQYSGQEFSDANGAFDNEDLQAEHEIAAGRDAQASPIRAPIVPKGIDVPTEVPAPPPIAKVDQPEDNEDKPKLSKNAIKRKKRQAKAARLASDKNSPTQSSTPSQIAPAVDALIHAHQEAQVLSGTPTPEYVSGQEDLPSHETELGAVVAAAASDAEANALVPTTRSEISIRLDHDASACKDHGASSASAEPCETSPSEDSCALSEAHTAPDFAAHDLVAQDQDFGRSGEWFQSPPPPGPLASTPQPTGLVGTYDGTDTDFDDERICGDDQIGQHQDDAPNSTKSSPAAPDADVTLISPGEDEREGTALQAQEQSFAANQTIPLVARRRQDFTMANISLPVNMRSEETSPRFQSFGPDSPSARIPNDDAEDGSNVDTVAQLFEQATLKAQQSPGEQQAGLSPYEHQVTPAPFETQPTPSSNSLATLVPPGASASEKEIVDRGCSIWVGGLPEDIDPAVLHTMFGPFGNITDVEIKNTLHSKTMKFAFVTFAERESAERALEADGTVIHGLRIVVRRRAINRIWVAPSIRMQTMLPGPPTLPDCPNPHAGSQNALPAHSEVYPGHHGAQPHPQPHPSQVQLLQDGQGQAYVYGYEAHGSIAGEAPSASHWMPAYDIQVQQGQEIQTTETFGYDSRNSDPSQYVRAPGRNNRKERGRVPKARGPGAGNGNGRPTADNNNTAAPRIPDPNAPIMQWGPLAQRAQNLESYYNTGTATANHGRSSTTVSSPAPVNAPVSNRPLRDAAIISTSETQGSPSPLHYRSGGLFYPGAFYASTPVTNTYISHSGDYYPGYVHAAPTHHQGWWYPAQYGPQAVTSATHAGMYAPDVEPPVASMSVPGSAYAYHANPSLAPSGAATPHSATYYPVAPAAGVAYPRAALQGILTTSHITPSEGHSPVGPAGVGYVMGVQSATNAHASAHTPSMDNEGIYAHGTEYVAPHGQARRGGRGRSRGFTVNRQQVQQQQHHQQRRALQM
ncbi:hypothetical protein V8E36_007068 [Tilletia maclaganii]